MVQATVAAHISAICTGALRHREEIVDTTSSSSSPPSSSNASPSPSAVTCTPRKTEGLPTRSAPKRPRAPPSRATGAAECDGGRSTEGRRSDEPGRRAGVAPPGLLLRKEGSEDLECVDTKDHHEKGEGGEGAMDAAAGTPSAPQRGTAPAALATVTTPARSSSSAAEDDGEDDHNEGWWEEDDDDDDDDDDEEEEEEEEAEEAEGHKKKEEGREAARPAITAVAGLNKLWRGTAAAAAASRAGTAAKKGDGRKRGKRAAGGARSGRWMQRREREAPFLRLLVGSQVGTTFGRR